VVERIFLVMGGTQKTAETGGKHGGNADCTSISTQGWEKDWSECSAGIVWPSPIFGASGAAIPTQGSASAARIVAF
jgi:hypothetical protein